MKEISDKQVNEMMTCVFEAAQIFILPCVTIRAGYSIWDKTKNPILRALSSVVLCGMYRRTFVSMEREADDFKRNHRILKYDNSENSNTPKMKIGF